MEFRCTPGEQILAMAALFSIEFSRDMEPNNISAWSDFFGVVAAGLIAISNRKLYITNPDSDCGCEQKEKDKEKKSQQPGNQTTTSSPAATAPPKKCSR